jgi:hypothetical protein
VAAKNIDKSPALIVTEMFESETGESARCSFDRVLEFFAYYQCMVEIVVIEKLSGLV